MALTHSHTPNVPVTPLHYALGVIDLHTHSSFSDGSDTPEQLAQKAHDLGISAIALTDHDTTLSHADMAAACERLGLELVNGVEVSLRDDEWPRSPGGESTSRNVHVLAYFLPQEPEHPLQRQLANLRSGREERNQQLVELLQAKGFSDLTLAYLTDMTGNVDSIGRPHFARAMVDLHPEIVGEPSVETTNRIFIDWLGVGGAAYIPRSSMGIQEFVDAGEGSGTIFSIAHPLINYLDEITPTSIETTMPKVMGSLRERGFKGIEAYYGGTSAGIRALMVKLTRDAAMIPTGGSDYHGTYKPDVELGKGRSGDLRVPNEVLAELKAAR
jgi:predicted metal-dependent phosphoesterase TrpH